MRKLLLMATLLLNTFALFGQEVTISNGTGSPIKVPSDGTPTTVLFTVNMDVPAGVTSGTLRIETGTDSDIPGYPPTIYAEMAILPVSFVSSTEEQTSSASISATFTSYNGGDKVKVYAFFCVDSDTTDCVYSDEGIDLEVETSPNTTPPPTSSTIPTYNLSKNTIIGTRCTGVQSNSVSLPVNGGTPGVILGSNDAPAVYDICGGSDFIGGESANLIPDYSWYSSTDGGVTWIKLPQTSQILQPDHIVQTTYYKRGTQNKKCAFRYIRFILTAYNPILYRYFYVTNDGPIVYSNVVRVNVGLVPTVNVCQDAPFTMNADGASTYNWYNGGGSTIIQTGPTLAVNGLSQSGYFKIVGSTPHCPDITQNVQVNVWPVNSPAPIITGTNALCSNQSGVTSQTYSLVNSDQSLTYQWSIAGTVATFSSSNTGNSVTVGISPITGSSGFTISAKAINPCGTSAAGSLYVSVDGSRPYSAPSAPTGPTTVINSAAPTSYSLSTIANAIYTITPSNAVTSSTTNQYGQVTVDWNNSFTGQASITAQLQNGCGTGPSSAPLTVQVNNPPPVVAVSGPSVVCNDGTTYWYLSNTSSPNVVFEILPTAAVKSYNYNVNAYGNVAVTWASTYSGPVTIRVSVNGGPWSPLYNVTVFDRNKSAVFSSSSMLAKASGIDPHLAFGTNDFTLEAWFKLGSTIGYTYPLFSTRQISPSAGFLFYVNPNSGGNAYLGISAEGANKNTIIPGGLTAGTWYHAAIVRTSGVLTYYLKGLQVGTTSSLTNSITAPRELWIGHDPSAPFNNLTIDEVRIWTRARTASEIYTNMDKNITGNDVNLVSYYTFDDPSSSLTYADYTIWNHTLTKGNDLTVETSYDPTSSTDVPYPGCTAGSLRLGDDLSTVSSNGLSSQNFDVSLYPNPTENSALLEISNNMASLATVEILSTSGEVVFKKDQVSTETQLSIGDNLSPGLYIIKVISGGNQKILKFVKSN